MIDVHIAGTDHRRLPGLARTYLAVALLLAAACGDRASPRRAVVGDDALTGIWTISMRLERPMSLRTDQSRLPRVVEGTIALLAEAMDPSPESGLSSPTHAGVYAIPLDSIEFAPVDSRMGPSVIAQLVERAGRPDSVYLVLNPGAPGHALHLAGVRADDVIHGDWTADAPLTGGGDFTLRQRRK